MTATAKRPDLKDECEHGNKPNSCWACSYKAQENKYDLIPLEEKKVAKVVSDVLFNRQEPVYNNSDVAKAICQKFGTPNTKKAEVISVEEKDFRFHGYNISQLIEIINFAKQHGYAEKN